MTYREHKSLLCAITPAARLRQRPPLACGDCCVPKVTFSATFSDSDVLQTDLIVEVRNL